MASGYNKGKAIITQKTQTEKINESFPKNVDASPNAKVDGMVAKNIPIRQLYEAPSHWNFYNELDENKKLELMESINENGLMSPIIVWEINKEKVKHLYDNHEDIYNIGGFIYMVLAGHNRVDAYMRLQKATKDIEYASIPAFIFLEKDLDEKSAKEIIVDTNYVQRVLSVEEMEKSILYKYDEIENNKTEKGRTRDIVAKALGVSPAKVAQYKTLSSMYEPLKKMVYSGNIALVSVLKISDKSVEVQKKIYETYADRLDNKLLNRVKPYMDWDDISHTFNKALKPKEVKKKKVSIEVPEDMVDEFKEMAYQWVYNRTKRD